MTGATTTAVPNKMIQVAVKSHKKKYQGSSVHHVLLLYVVHLLWVPVETHHRSAYVSKPLLVITAPVV